MRRRERTSGLTLILESLAVDPTLCLEPDGNDFYRLSAGAGKGRRIAMAKVKDLVSAGLLRPAGSGAFRADPALNARLRRMRAGQDAFLAQHARLADQPGGEPRVRVNLDEWPLAALARRGRDGAPFLEPAAIAAAERLRGDFEFARLQPRITASWSATVNTGRRDGSQADLADNVVAARKRVEAAIQAVGLELSGVLLDTCCFLKGLETVERERRWPARSAKLVLRLALAALARHYGIGGVAEGAARGAMRHWGATGYRPTIG